LYTMYELSSIMSFIYILCSMFHRISAILHSVVFHSTESGTSLADTQKTTASAT
jgi:hypothetical protein